MIETTHTTLILGDCLQEMQKLPERSIDMVLCDLPYGVTQNPWDSILPLEQLWKTWHRVTKSNAAIVLFGQGMFTSILMQSNSKEWRYNLISDKHYTTGFLNANKMPLRQHEDIVVFYHTLPIYHPQKTERETTVRFQKRTNITFNYGKYNNNYDKEPETDTK